MNDIVAITLDQWVKDVNSIPAEWEWSTSTWFWERFGLRFLVYIRSDDGGRYLYQITDPAGYTMFLLRRS